ncbi:MAG: hypothetical protein J5I91_08530 [Bacteroidetes bacterium]|nr:hypothetical protein [Bacteroidota bacterium]
MFHYASSGFETFIYIVFGILYLLYKYSSAKKEKEKKTPQHSLPKVDILEQFDKLLNRKEAKIPEDKPSPVSVPYHYNNKPQKKATQKELELIDIDEIHNTQEGKILDISAREAIIVSEILKRPEY